MISYLHNIDSFSKIVKDKGNYIILGGPGTGKTLFLTEFVVFLTENIGIPSERILVLTFNRKSSKYLRDEIAKKADRTVSEIDVKTFYSFCLDFLENYFTKFGKEFDEIKILTAPEQWNLLTEIILKTDKKKIPRISKLFSNVNTRENIVQEIFDYILRAQENLFEPSDLFDKFNPYTNNTLLEINKIYSAFEELLEKEKIFNYGKLLKDSFVLINKDYGLKASYTKSYEFILIDELHELNFAQYKLLEAISDNNIIYFGDDDQSVYRFRGSNINIFFRVFDSIPPDRRIFLKNNYRNSQMISDVMHEFISKNSKRINKDKTEKFICECSSEVGYGKRLSSDIMVKSFENNYAELSFIKNKILFLNKVLKVDLDKIAVIMKGTDFESELIENFFYQNSIPFFKSGSRSMNSNKYSAYFLNICRLLCMLLPDNGENKKTTEINQVKNTANTNIDLLIKKILLSDFINIDPVFFKEIEFLYTESKRNGQQIFDFYNYLIKNLKNIKKKDENSFFKILNLIKSLNKYKRYIKEDVFAFICRLLYDDKIGLFEVIKNYFNLSQYDKNSFIIFTNFLASLKNFTEERKEKNDIYFYLDFIDSFSNNQFIEETESSLSEGYKSNGVRIISFYDCKNIEFEAVFIPFLNKGYIPSSIVKPQIYENDFIMYFFEGRFLSEEEQRKIHLENERRIIYTGISRCKNYLYMTCTTDADSSSFYKELREIIFERRKVITERSRSNMEYENIYKDSMEIPEKSLIRKKAIVYQYRIEDKKKINKDKFDYFLKYLKTDYHPSMWWSLVNEIGNNLKPSKEADYGNCFSYTSLDVYDSCPFKYKMKYFLGLTTREDNVNITIGSIYHNIIHRFFTESKRPDIDSLLSIMNEELDRNKDKFEFGFYFREIKNDMRKDFLNFYDNFGYIINKNKQVDLQQIALTEKEFLFSVGERNKVRGRIDLINLSSDENIELIDFKASQRNYSKEELEKELQLKIYYLALKKGSIKDVNIPEIGERDILLKYYVIRNEKNNFFSVDISDSIEKETTSKILEIINNIKKERFTINPRDYYCCKLCDYKIFCEKYYGEQI